MGCPTLGRITLIAGVTGVYGVADSRVLHPENWGYKHAWDT